MSPGAEGGREFLWRLWRLDFGGELNVAADVTSGNLRLVEHEYDVEVIRDGFPVVIIQEVAAAKKKKEERRKKRSKWLGGQQEVTTKRENGEMEKRREVLLVIHGK